MREPSIKKRIKTVVVLLLVAGLSARAAWYWRELRRDREITNWLRTHAIRLQTVDPMSDLADLKPLAPVIATPGSPAPVRRRTARASTSSTNIACCGFW